MEEARARLKELDDTAYFELLSKMLDKYSTGKEGVIRLSARDLNRIPAEFQAKALTTTFSKDAVNIDGGFVIVYSDIEENCSFDALISASRFCRIRSDKSCSADICGDLQRSGIASRQMPPQTPEQRLLF